MAESPLARRPRLLWTSVSERALLPENLPRVLAGMGFDQHVATLDRGAIAWWPPQYHRIESWRARFARSDAAAGRGFRAGAFTPSAEQMLDGWDVRDRRAVGEINRALRDAAVLMMRRRRPERVVYVDAFSGEWRDLCGAVRGEDVVSLAALMLGKPYGAAAFAVARLCGMPAIPTLPSSEARHAA